MYPHMYVDRKVTLILYTMYTVMGRIAIIDRQSDPDRDLVRKRESGSAKDRVTNGG